MRVRSPITTCGPIDVPGPTTTSTPSCARGSTNAAGWTWTLIGGSSLRSSIGSSFRSWAAIHHRGEQFRLGDEPAVHERLASHLHGAPLDREQRELELELVAGHD